MAASVFWLFSSLVLLLLLLLVRSFAFFLLSLTFVSRVCNQKKFHFACHTHTHTHTHTRNYSLCIIYSWKFGSARAFATCFEITRSFFLFSPYFFPFFVFVSLFLVVVVVVALLLCVSRRSLVSIICELARVCMCVWWLETSRKEMK